MHPIHRRRFHAHPIHAALRYSSSSEWQKPNVPAAIMPSIHIRIRGFWNEPKAVHLKQLREIGVLFSLKIEGRLLGVVLNLWTLLKTSCLLDRHFSCCKIVIQQHSRSHQLSSDIIEAVFHYFLGKIRRWVPGRHIQAQQIPNGLLVLPCVDSSQNAMSA